MIMLFVTDEFTGNRGMDWLIEESGMPHADHLADFDFIALFDIDVAFRTSCVIGRDENPIRYASLESRKHTQ